MDNEIAMSIMTTAPFTVLLPFSLAVCRIKNGGIVQKRLSILVFLSAFFEFAILTQGRILNIENLFLFNIYPIFEIILIGWIFSVFLSKQIIYPLVTLVLLFIFFDIIIIQNLNQSFTPLASGVEALIVIFLSLNYYYWMAKDLKVQKIETTALFWISSGLLIYFSGSFFVFIFSNYMNPRSSTGYAFWAVHALSSIILYIFYVIALWMQPQKENFLSS